MCKSLVSPFFAVVLACAAFSAQASPVESSHAALPQMEAYPIKAELCQTKAEPQQCTTYLLNLFPEQKARIVNETSVPFVSGLSENGAPDYVEIDTGYQVFMELTAIADSRITVHYEIATGAITSISDVVNGAQKLSMSSVSRAHLQNAVVLSPNQSELLQAGEWTVKFSRIDLAK